MLKSVDLKCSFRNRILIRFDLKEIESRMFIIDVLNKN